LGKDLKQALALDGGRVGLHLNLQNVKRQQDDFTNTNQTDKGRNDD
jgi:hypothetical protein